MSDGSRGAGALLRAAREKQGLHIAALAAAIKVAPRKLDALENDRWDELPDATFTRALAQTVCRTLKIDAREVLDLLPPASSVPLDAGQGALNAPFRERPGRGEPSSAMAGIRPMVWAAALLLLAAVAVYVMPPGLLPATLKLGAPPAAVNKAAEPAAPAVASITVAPAASAAASAAAEAGMPAPGAPAAAEAAASGVPAVAGAAAVPVPPAAAAAASAAIAGEVPGLVVLRTSNSSWVEARDGHGTLLLSRIVQPGEALGLDGPLPIRMTIGNAAATQVAFRGQPVDLAPRTRDNVARVELQ